MTTRQRPRRKAESRPAVVRWYESIAEHVAPVLWTALLATVFFLLANPYVFIRPFSHSLEYAVLFTLGVLILLFPSLQAPRLPFEVLLFLAFCALSSLWSQDSSATWAGVVLYGAIMLLAIVIGANAGRAVLVEGIAWGGVAIVLASWYAYAHRLEGSGVLDSVGVLAGVGANRNILGYTLALALPAAIADLPRANWRRVVRLAAVATILVGIYLSGSATALLSASIVLTAAALIVATQRWAPGLTPKRRRIALASGLGVFVVGIVCVQQVASLLGRGSTLSGRVPLWSAIIEVTEEHQRLLVGLGWSSVWQHPWLQAPSNDAVDAIYEGAEAHLYHGHNSLFDLLPEIGIVGIALALLPLIRAGVRGVRLLGIRPGSTPGQQAASRFVLLGVIALVTLGLTEPLMTIPVGWFYLVLLAQLPSDDPAPRISAPVRREVPVVAT